jgi:3-hydroxyisobutyrate dehydrogenase
MIAHFGTGLMGAGFVRAARQRGETVHVWNRSPERARELEADGAIAFADPAEAAAGAERIHLTLKDDASVDAVLEPIAARIDPHTLIIDHTTTAPTPTAERYARWYARDRFFAHVPMFMGPMNARESTGLMLTSGPQARYERLQPIIAPMTGKFLYYGEGDERAAAFKLFGNMMLVFITSGLADVFAFAESMGIAPLDAHALFDNFKAGGSIDARGKKMASGDFTPQFELSMARKDVQLMLEEAERHGKQLSVLPAIAALMDRGIAAGYGNEDYGAVMKVR